MGLLDPAGFRRNRHGQIWLHLGTSERAVLGDLLGQLAELLDPGAPPTSDDPLEELVGIEPGAVRPDDPVMARLFPDAYADPEEADEFRRFTQRDLKSGKRQHLATVRATLDRPDPTELDADEAQAWLVTLNDLRLALGTRLGVSEDDGQRFTELGDEDPHRAMYLVYDWLTYHQEKLVRALDRGLR